MHSYILRWVSNIHFIKILKFFFNRVNDNFENKKMRFQTKILFGEKTVSRGFGSNKK